MIRLTIFLLVFFLMENVYAQPRQHVQTGRVIVKLKADAVPTFETSLRKLQKPASDTSVLQLGVKSFDNINRRYRASQMRRLFPDAGKYEAKHRKYGLHLWYEIEIPETADPETVAKTYGVDGNVQLAEPHYKIRSMAMTSSAINIPGDPGFSKQWNYHNTGQTGGTAGVDISLPEAWTAIDTLGIANRNVIVAVVDGGVYYDHEDLRANMWVNEAELNGTTGVDDDGNGYKDDIYGFNFVKNRNTTIGTLQPEDHATHVAGTIAAVTDNATGVAGISGNPGKGYGIKIMSTQIMSGNASASSIVEAFTYAADNGAVISQNSWGYEKANVYNQSDIEAINYFINEAGTDENSHPRPGTPMVGGIVIFAAGNDSQDAKWYPAYFDNVLAVSAVNHYGKRAWYSNYGSWVDIAAPGGDTQEKEAGGIYSTSYRSGNKNYYEYMQGTSMACPHVSGVAAMVLSVYGNESFTPDMLRARLLNTATSLALFDSGNASGMGAGLLNAEAAIVPGETPGIITNLSVSSTTPVSATLNWTVPQIANNGTVSAYVIAVSTMEITENNFGLHAIPAASSSVKPGETQQATVSGLTPGTQYYISVRSIGNLGDASGISNIVDFATRSNIAPVVKNPYPDISIRDVAPETVFYMGELFVDGDGDALAYDAATNSKAVATVRMKNDTLLIQPVAAGNTVVTLTASDGFGGQATFGLPVTVTQNHAPRISGLLNDTTLIPFANPVVINLSNYISDPEQDKISCAYQLSQTGIVNASISGNNLTIDPRYHGFVTLQLTASDPYGAASNASINITVEQKYAPDKVGKLLVYPNPVSDILHFSFILDEEVAPVQIRIVNAVGKVVYKNNYSTVSAGIHYNEIDLSAWNPGLYVLQYIKNNKVMDTKKIIKQ